MICRKKLGSVMADPLSSPWSIFSTTWKSLRLYGQWPAKFVCQPLAAKVRDDQNGEPHVENVIHQRKQIQNLCVGA